MTDPNKMSLGSRLAGRVAFGVTIGIGVLFVPAGSFHFWEGWVFVAEMVAASLFMSIYFYRHDRGLLRAERGLEGALHRLAEAQPDSQAGEHLIGEQVEIAGQRA